ncbi:M1 family metallopeptidase [Pyrobaculum calidifontis]|uniref:Peptidase M1, membrane alanine aminopeptidase n=1 Tax=Pyrobaculum calidifontis (strain DSM 21063 / JCM 11548 / VA1) TaxID=410359 RepID=A3MTR9_PYRCJ|nr:M1 family metallopeptidase [Pyrobaculum calidifontis]ABO08036.1 peptidase M1, membrane alanine aminopeptidase [Pyrobaculum calidifontis JCM 11548]
MKYLVGRDFAFPEYLPRHPRSYDFDVVKMSLDVEVDLENGAVEGVVKYVVRAKKSGAVVVLDAVDIEVLGVSHDYFYDGAKLEIRPEWKSGEQVEVVVRYRARPRVGMFFVRRGKEVYMWTQGETEYNRYWVPLPDSPNVKFPWSVSITVPKPYVAGSNGVLVEVKERGDKLVYVWEMRHPMSPYLLALAVGNFKVYKEKCGDVELEYYLPSYVGEEWKFSFYNTCSIMQFLSQYLGVPYPYERYAQVVVPEFIYGGMENTTFTILTDWTIHDKHAQCPYSGFPCLELEDFSSHPLVAHEMAHMWFGDLVTAKDWAHITINESFATFLEALWTERSKGRDEYLYEIYTNFKIYLGEYSRRYSRPIVTNIYKIPDEVFDRHAYEKGSVVLHMLRSLLGDEVFRRGLKTFLERYRYKAVDVEDLRKVFEEVSERDLEWFWNQFFYSAGHPVLKVSWNYSMEDKAARVQIRQTQGEDSFPVYTLPLELKIVYEDGRREVKSLVLNDKELSFTLHGKPKYICVDPGFKILKSLDPQYPLESAVAMLEDEDLYCRLQAVEALKKNGSPKAVDALAKALRDNFWGVASEAAKALGEVGTAEAVAKLIEAYPVVAHPRARRAIIEALGNTRRREAAEFLDRVLHDVGESYYVRAEAARALGKTRWEFAEHSLRKALEYSSHLEVIKRGALEGLAELGSEEALRLVLKYAEEGVPTVLRMTAVQALAKFGPRREVLEVIRRALRDENFRVRYAAVAAALELLEPRLLPDLEERIERDLDGRIRRMAREVVEKIRKAMERGAEYQRLREEVEKLREEYRKLLDRVARLERV